MAAAPVVTMAAAAVVLFALLVVAGVLPAGLRRKVPHFYVVLLTRSSVQSDQQITPPAVHLHWGLQHVGVPTPADRAVGSKCRARSCREPLRLVPVVHWMC